MSGTTYQQLNDVKAQEGTYFGWHWRKLNTWWWTRSSAHMKKSSKRQSLNPTVTRSYARPADDEVQTVQRIETLAVARSDELKWRRNNASNLDSTKNAACTASDINVWRGRILSRTSPLPSAVSSGSNIVIYRVILSVLDPRKCEYLKDYSLDFEHAYMTTYLASWEACRY